MNIGNISFGAKFHTKEVANLAGGGFASREFLAGVSGKPKEQIMSDCNSDVYAAGSRYAAGKVVEQHPELWSIRELSRQIQKETNVGAGEEMNVNKIMHLADLKTNKIDEFCKNHGEFIDIEPFEIPFFKNNSK